MRPEDTVSDWVNGDIETNSRLLPVFQEVSRSYLMWQGVYSAGEWTLLYQPDKGQPLLKSQKLYLIANGYGYSVTGLAKESEYDSYSSTIDSIIDSFRIAQ